MTAAGGVTFAFIVGTGRCGSTLVQEVLSRHPAVGFISNVDNALAPLDLKGRFNNPLYRSLPAALSGRTTRGERPGWGRPASSSGAEADAGSGGVRLDRVRFAPSEAYRLITRRVSPFVTAPDRDLTVDDAKAPYAQAFRRLFEARARVQRRPVFLHHFTGWPRAGFVHATLPRTRFVHVVRDGRAVAASLARMPWWPGRRGVDGWGFGELPRDDLAAWTAAGRSPVLLAGLEWRLLVGAAERAQDLLPEEDWLQVRYEDVLADPPGAVRSMLEHLGLDWTAEFARQFARCAFRPARVGSFRHDLDPADLRLLEALLEEPLARYGYLAGPAGG